MFARVSDKLSDLTGHPLGLLGAVLISIASCLIFGIQNSILVISLVTWWQLFPLQASQNRTQASQDRDTAEIKELLRELVRDLPDVDEEAANRRIEEL